MSYRGVFLDKVHPNVKKKLDYMHSNAGAIQRINRDEELQTPWIKLTSNAASKEVGFPVAKDYVMYSDILDSSDNKKSHEKLEGWQKGGGLYGSNNLNRPVPIIDGITVSSKGALGSIRTANIKGTVFAETDLVWFEKLYMMPGITLLLEWGHSNTDTTPIVIGPDTKVTDVQIDILKKTLKSNDFRSQDGNPDVDDTQVKDVGTYDAMLGVITKFNWTNGDQGYDFNIDIISPNSVMNSFNMSTNTLGIKLKQTTTVDDYSFKNDEDTKKTTSSNVTPLDDFEGMLTHLQNMGESISNVDEKVHLKKNDEGKLEDMGPDPLQDYKKASLEGDFEAAFQHEKDAKKYANKINITRKTSKSTVLDMNDVDSDAIPYSLGGGLGPVGKNTIVYNSEGHLVGMTAHVPNNETFNTDKENDYDIAKAKVSTFISWMFLEELINSRLPGEMGAGKHKKKLVKLNSTTLDKDGKYYANQISGHKKISSVNRGVCQLIGDNTLPYKYESGEFNYNFPTWSGKEKFDVLSGNRFFKNEEDLNKYAKHFLNPGGVGGSLDGLWLNVDFIIQKYRQNKSEFNKFLFALLSGVNSACGEPWDFHIQNNPNDPGKMAIVDLNMVDKEIADEIRSGEGLHVYKFRTQLGILRNISLSSKLPKAIASSAYVAAAAANAGDYDAGSGMNLYQKDKTKPIYDSLSIRNADVDAIQTKGDDEDEKDSQLPSTHIKDMKMAAWKAIIWGKDISSAQTKMKDYVNKEIKQNNKDEEGDVTSMPTIPIELSFSMDGLSGLYMGNAVMLDTIEFGGIIPDRYKHGVAFQITQVSHTVNASGWDTSISCMMRMTGLQKTNYQEAPTRNPSTAEIVDKTAPTPTPGSNGPPSSRSVSALHPVIQNEWGEIESALKAKGWQPQVITAFRSIEEQGEKLAKGYSKVGYGFHGCLAADGSRASQALDVIDSRYSYGNSPSSIKSIGKKATEDKARKFWGDLGNIAEGYGFRWGGKFGKNGSAYYDFNGTPSSNKIMGWDPGHIEKFGKDGLPTLTEAAENAGKFLGRKIHLRANNVV